MLPKLFFASAEMDEARDVLDECNIEYRMMSFYYLKYKWGINKTKRVLEQALKTSKVFLDSGAYTFLSAPQYKRKFEKDISKFWHNVFDYFESYYKLVEEYQNDLYAIADIDFDDILRKYFFLPFQVLKIAPELLRRDILDFLIAEDANDERLLSSFEFTMPPLTSFRHDLLSLNVPVVIVHHESRGLKAWEYICKKYPYVGYTIKRRKIVDAPYFNTARKYGTRVHGFGITSHDLLTKYPWYSVDSTNWKYCVAFGATMLFKNGRVKYYDRDTKSIRNHLGHYCERNGLDKEKIVAEDRHELLRLGIKTWKLYQDYIVGRKKYYLFKDWNLPEERLSEYRHKKYLEGTNGTC